MADKTATFAIKLQDDTSGAALSAAQALKTLEDSIAGDTKELAGLQKAMKNLQGGTLVNIDQYRKLQQRIAASKESIAKAQGEFVSLGGAFKTSDSSGKGLMSRFAALTKSAQAMPGPFGGIVGKLSKVAELVGGNKIAFGIAGIAAALTALVVATALAAKSLYDYGIAQADARRSEFLRLEGLAKLRTYFQRIPGDAKQMQAAIDQVAAKTPLAREKVYALGEELHRMGIRGTNYAKALEGAAIKTAVQGEAAGHAFAGWAAGAALTGRSVDRLVDNVKAKLGGIAQRQMSSLTVQTLKQKEAQDALFGGLEMDAYLDAWKGVKDLLTQATASGRALKVIVTSVLQPLIGGSTAAAPIVKRFFQGMIIAALHLAIVIVTVKNWFEDTFGDSSLFSGLGDMNIATKIGEAALWALIAALALATVVAGGLAIKLTAWLVPALWKSTGAIIRLGFGGFERACGAAYDFVAAMWSAIVPLLPFMLAAFGVGLAIYTLIKYWDDLKMVFSQVDWLEVGKDILRGIIDGLSNPGALLTRMKDLASEAVTAFEQMLGIASPSKVFMRAGLAIPEGVAQGVDAGAPEAQSAAANMLEGAASAPKLGKPSAPGGAPESGGAVAASRGSVAITIEQITVTASSNEPKTMAADFRRELELVLESLAAELGASLTPRVTT